MRKRERKKQRDGDKTQTQGTLTHEVLAMGKSKILRVDE